MTNTIQINNLSKQYNNKVKALNAVNLTIKKGDFYALLGPNGAGKSTTIGILSSLITPTSGSINVFGLDFKKDSQQIKQQIGIVPQEFNFNIFETPLQIVINQAGYYGITQKTAYKKAKELLTELELWDKHNVSSKTLSGGQKRRLMIARALVHNPKLLILDEPTAGVDISLRRQMWEFLQRWNNEGLTIILTTHYLEEAEYLCNHIAIIDKGNVIADTTTEELLQTLKTETLVFTTSTPYKTLPTIPNVTLTPKDDITFECNICSNTHLSTLIEAFKKEDLIIHRMINKANRLESLFVDLVGENNV